MATEQQALLSDREARRNAMNAGPQGAVARVEDAIGRLQRGRMIFLTDDEDREI